MSAPKAFLFTLSLPLLISSAYAGSITIGPKVDLNCTLQSQSDAEKLSVQIKEIGPSSAGEAVNAGVPDVFINLYDKEWDYQIRKFSVTGAYEMPYGTSEQKKGALNNTYYGNFALPDANEWAGPNPTIYAAGFEQQNHRAFSIQRGLQAGQFQFLRYYTSQNAGSSDRGIDCTGTIPAAASVKKYIAPGTPYTRYFYCQLKKSTTLSAQRFSFTVANLQNPSGLQVSVLDGKGIKNHELNVINQSKSVTVQGNALVLSGSVGAAHGTLGLGYPGFATKGVSGRFDFVGANGAPAKANVECSLARPQ